MRLAQPSETNWLYLIIVIAIGSGVCFGIWKLVMAEDYSVPEAEIKIWERMKVGDQITIKGMVINNFADCEVEGECYLHVKTDFREAIIIYSPKWEECANSKMGKQAVKLEEEDRVEIFGEVIDGDMITICSSEDYYIKKIKDE
jgi:hypothetical protein